MREIRTWNRRRPARAGITWQRATALAFTLLLVTGAVGAIQPHATHHHHQRNYDARINANATLRVAPDAAQIHALEALRAQVPELGVEMDDTTGVTRTLWNQTGYLTGPSGLESRAAALAFVHSKSEALGLSSEDLANYEITDEVFTKVTGASHLYLRQTYQGIPLYNGQLHVNVNRNGQIISVNNAFLPGLTQAVNIREPRISASRAVQAAAKSIGIDAGGLPRVIRDPQGAIQATGINPRGISQEAITASLAWLPIRTGQARLVWNFQIKTEGGFHHYDFTVDAENASVWTRFDWVADDSYRVYPLPAESPNHVTPVPPADGRSVVVDPADATASPLGWHNDGSTSRTIMRGNNVHAFENLDGNSSPPTGSEPSCGASLDCDFPIDLTQAPTAYSAAAVANLFYLSNVIHDIQYQYGFDEAAGNFQESNFGNGGVGGDYLLGRAQDQSFNCPNNAFFSTPPEGSNPSMLMCLWTAPNPDKDGDLDSGIVVHEYGHGISTRQVGGPSNSGCLSNNQQGGEGWSDWFTLAYTHEVGDQGTDARGIGTYALNQPVTGAGIRTQRYSTNPAVNNHTYESIQGMAIPHGVGEVWGQALWEVYWALVDQYGFDPDLYNAAGGAGNHRAMLYVNEGLKNTACSPTFTQARDGIIQAAVDNFGGADVCLLWDTFAAFGLGTDAVSGGSNSTSPTNGFAIPASCACSPNPIADAGPDQAICQGESVQIGTPAQAAHTYSWAPGGQTSAQITVSPAVTTNYTVTATTSCGNAQDSVVVTVDDGSGGGLNEDFEGSVAGWTATGLWHQVTNSTCASPSNGYSSPVNSFYFGSDSTCDYSGTNTGTLTSPVITGITSSSTLSFDYFRQVESFSGNFDQTEVRIVTGSGSTTVFALDSSTPSQSAWVSSGTLSLSAFAGQAIQVEFFFDTVDGVDNDQIGWFIDDVVVTGDSPCGPGNTAPTVNITAPADGTSVTQGTSISFAGNASDAEDGSLTGSLSWTSSIDGSIGSGGSFSATLSAGTHTVTASVTDSGGLSGSDNISVTVTVPTNDPPTVNITSPADGTTVTEGTSISFAGNASDPEDGDLTGSLSWSSDLDGSIGSGGSFSATLSVGTHTVTASVTDSGGLPASDNISVTVNPSTPGCTDCIDWSTTATVSYSNQDADGDVTVEDGGDTLFLQGNTWRRTTVTFDVTAATVLEFDFMSTGQGEIHGIGFDEDDTLTNDTRIFQLYGTQNWGGAFHDFDDYTTGEEGTFRTYQIPVGTFYTGSAMRLVLVNDNDAGTGSNSRFRNVRVIQPPPPSCTVQEDFESSPGGWANDGASTCSTGAYVFGAPTQQTSTVVTQVGGDHTPAPGTQAIFTASNSSAGNADVDGGNCILTSPPWSVANASTLSIWYFHGQRDTGDDPSGDFFRLEVSTDDGANYTPIVNIGDVRTVAAWTNVTTQIPAGSDVRIRVQTSDGPSTGDIVEGGIDDLSICDN